MVTFIEIIQNVFTPEMAHDVIESQTFLWTTRIIDIISTTIITFILASHLYTIITYNRCRSTNQPKTRRSIVSMSEALESWTLTLNLLTISYILLQFVLLIILTLNIWEVLPTTLNCDVIVFIMVTLYHLSKSIFYCILITRLQVAFLLSSMKYSTCTIISLYAFVVIYTIFVCVGTPFLIYGVWVEAPVNWCHIHTLNTTMVSISIGVWILMDVVISIILCYLFIRPIKQVLKLNAESPNASHSGSRSNSLSQGRFTIVYIKYALLTYISIILNMVGLLLYLFKHLTIVIEVTAAINCICIIFMHAKYQPAFDFFCGWLVQCCIKRKARQQREREGNRVETNVTLSLKETTSDGEKEKTKHKQKGYKLSDKPDDIIPADGGAMVENLGLEIGLSVEESSQNTDSSEEPKKDDDH